MKTAICLSGLARTYRQTHVAFQRNIVAPLSRLGPVDVFISVWDTTDIGALAPVRLKKESPVNLSELARLYHPCTIEAENFDALKNAFALSNLTPHECPVPAIVRNGILLAAPAQYKVIKCNNMKKLHEQANGMRYDWVVRTRLDFEIAPLRVDELDPTKVNCLYDHDGLLGDYFYIATSEVMDALCEVFPNYGYLLGLDGTDMGPERNLKNQANHRGLTTQVLRNHDFTLVRDTHRQEYHWDEAMGDYRPEVRVKWYYYLWWWCAHLWDILYAAILRNRLTHEP